MITRFRAFETNALLTKLRTVRQFVVAVTANGGQAGVSGFDGICSKPLSVNDIHQIVNKHL